MASKLPVLVPTGVHIPNEKTAMFMFKFGNALRTYFNIEPYFGASIKINHSEVKFKYKGGDQGASVYIKKAKKFLEESINFLNTSKKTPPQIKKKVKSPSVPQIIDLVNENTPLRPAAVRTVDLTETDPEIIVLDETFSQLNKTLSQLDSTIINISNIDLTEISESTPKCVINKNYENDIQILTFKTNKKRLGLGSNYKTVPDSEVQILGSTFKLKNKNRSIEISDSETPNLSMSKNISNKYKRNLKMITYSNGDLLSSAQINSQRKKRKTKNITSTPTRCLSSPKTLSGNALKYYSRIQKAIKLSKLAKHREKLSGSHATMGCVPNQTKTSKSARAVSQIDAKKKNKQKVKLKYHKYNVSKQKPYVENNIFNPNPYDVDKEGLRPVVIDGSNIAVGHGRGRFSVKGIKICVEYFQSRGHDTIKVFLPQHRKDSFSTELLEDLNNKCDMVFTPSRCINGVQKTPYDDRFIVQYAVEFGGVIVSTDNYRDLLRENPRWRDTIHKRLLMFTWVDDFLMFPMDPLGKHGPTLEEFLRF